MSFYSQNQAGETLFSLQVQRGGRGRTDSWRMAALFCQSV